MTRTRIAIFALALFTVAASPELCGDPRFLRRVRTEVQEDAATRKDRLEHEVRAAGMLSFGTPVALPHRELLTFDPNDPVPAIYALGVQRGQEVRATVAAADPNAIPDVRLALFANDGEKFRRIAVARGIEPLKAHATFTGTHYVMIEAGANATGTLLVDVAAGASLTFPVRAKDSRAIKSFFGDIRERGRRTHQGVDIFAPKGTEAIAACDGRVVRVGYSGLGGKVVWLADEERTRFFYYAHLDAFEAVEGATVKAGDVLGYVGNTGNARTTPSHLHFGVYAPTAVDPLPFVHEPAGVPKKIIAKPQLIGRTVEISAKKTSLFASPDAKSTVVTVLSRERKVRILGASAAFYRVLLDEQAVGYVRQDAVRAAPPAS